jgi:hypothetical protein
MGIGELPAKIGRAWEIGFIRIGRRSNAIIIYLFPLKYKGSYIVLTQNIILIPIFVQISFGFSAGKMSLSLTTIRAKAAI